MNNSHPKPLSGILVLSQNNMTSGMNLKSNAKPNASSIAAILLRVKLDFWVCHQVLGDRQRASSAISSSPLRDQEKLKWWSNVTRE